LRALLDEMYSGLKDYLEALECESKSVDDLSMQGAPDKAIVEYARNKGLLLVTRNQRQAELAFLPGVKHVLVTKPMMVKRIKEGIFEKYPGSRMDLRQGKGGALN